MKPSKGAPKANGVKPVRPQPNPGFAHPVTLAVDIGGTGLKVMALDAHGHPLSERLRTPTPDPATPAQVLEALEGLREKLPACDRVSVGFPGVIKHGKTLTAVNLHPEWDGYPLLATLEKRWKRCRGTGQFAGRVWRWC
jgi:polyphosphate glucokinase